MNNYLVLSFIKIIHVEYSEKKEFQIKEKSIKAVLNTQ